MRLDIELLGIKLFDSDKYCDMMGDYTQYTDVNWSFNDMKKYDGMVVALYLDGKLTIYDSNNEIVFNGSLMDSLSFKKELLMQIAK